MRRCVTSFIFQARTREDITKIVQILGKKKKKIWDSKESNEFWLTEKNKKYTTSVGFFSELAWLQEGGYFWCFFPSFSTQCILSWAFYSHGCNSRQRLFLCQQRCQRVAAEITPTLQLIRVQRPHLYHAGLISQPGPCEPRRLSVHSTGIERTRGSHERELLIAGCKKAVWRLSRSLERGTKTDL